MISMNEYQKIISDLLDELPPEFLRDLSGGVIVSDALVIPDYAENNDLFTLGLYKIFSPGVRQIIMYKGSFDRAYPYADTTEAREILRGVLRHEFRHHLEFLAGIHDSTSLEAADEQEKREYLARHNTDAHLQ